jgi:hypothetical protein
VAQTFLQLVLLSIIMVGQNVQAACSPQPGAVRAVREKAVILCLESCFPFFLPSQVPPPCLADCAGLLVPSQRSKRASPQRARQLPASCCRWAGRHWGSLAAVSPARRSR